MLKLRFLLLVLLALGLAAGCNRSKTQSKVSGKVTYKGQLVKGGSIVFHSEDMGSYPSSLSPEGTYEMVDLPAGPMTVTIETESLAPDKKARAYPGRGGAGSKAAAIDNARLAAEGMAGSSAAAQKEAAERYVKIPKKYADAKTSPLKVTLERGKQVKDFELTDD
jgi:hypothetical protein